MGGAPSKSAGRTGGSAARAEAVVAEADHVAIEKYLAAMAGEGPGADRAARVLEQVALMDAAMLAGHVPELLSLMYGGRPRVAQAAGIALSELTKTTPAKVGKHLGTLRDHADSGSAEAQAGTFMTLVGLCRASVSYQRRVQDLLENALRKASSDDFLVWARMALPVLKGEPYAELRSLVEARLPTESAKKARDLADELGLDISPC